MLCKSAIMQKQTGFTLIEVLIALTVFAVGILAIAAMQGTALRAAAGAEQLTRGRAAAKSTAERLLALPFDHPSLADRDGDGDSGLDDTTSSAAGMDGRQADFALAPDEGDLRVYWNVAESTPRSDAKTVRVLSLWDERGQSRRARFTFIKTEAL